MDTAALAASFPLGSPDLPGPLPGEPEPAGGVLYGGASGLAHPLAPWTGFGLLCAYAAVLIGFAAWRLRRADA